MGEDINTSDISQLKYVRTYEERQIEEMFANREKCIEFEKYKSLFEKIQIEIKGFEKILSYKRPDIKRHVFYIRRPKDLCEDVGESFIQEYGIKMHDFI